MKRQERSRRARRLGSLETLESRALMTMSAVTPLPNMEASVGTFPAAISLDSYFKDAHATSDYALINTSAGTIPVVLTPQTAPNTVATFLNNIKQGDYTNTLVDRSVPGSSWEAGGYQVSADSVITPVAPGTPISGEVGGADLRGTIAMAPDGTGSRSSATRFVFNAVDNPTSKATVIGHVVGQQGLTALDSIAAIPVPAASPLGGSLAQAPLQYYTPGQPVQAYNLTKIDNVTTASEYFETVSDAPGIASAAVSGNQLTITPMAVGTAHVAVVAYGSDGTPATETFTVRVEGSPQPAGTALRVSASALGSPLPASSPAPLPTPVAARSSVIPAARGTVPAVVVAGQKTKLQQTVTLTDATTAIPQGELVTLSLSSAIDSSSYTIASINTKAKPKLGKPLKVTLAANRIGAGVPAGAYHLFVTTTDPDGASANVDTGQVITVRAPTATAGK